MFKQQSNSNLIDNRNIPTRTHRATVFKVCLPKCEKYKGGTVYKGAVMWNHLPHEQRNLPLFTNFKYLQKREMLATNTIAWTVSVTGWNHCVLYTTTNQIKRVFMITVYNIVYTLYICSLVLLLLLFLLYAIGWTGKWMDVILPSGC